MLDGTINYVKKNTGVVIPLGVLGGLVIIFLGWAYSVNEDIVAKSADHEARIIKVEVNQVHIQKDLNKISETTQKIYEHLLGR